MNTIEFVGPSGIGKTTFLQSLLKARKNTAWITRAEGVKLIKNRRSNTAERAVIKAGRFFGLSLSLPGQDDDHIKKIKQFDPHCSLLVDLFLESLNKKNFMAWQKVLLHEFYIKKHLYNYILMDELFENKTVVSDEGIIQNGGITSVLNNYEKYKGIIQSKLFPKAVIFFDLDVNQYRERLHSRFRERGNRNINPFRPNMTDDELEGYMVKTKEEAKNKLESCKMLDMPALKLEPVPTDANINRAMAFISRFTSESTEREETPNVNSRLFVDKTLRNILTP